MCVCVREAPPTHAPTLISFGRVGAGLGGKRNRPARRTIRMAVRMTDDVAPLIALGVLSSKGASGQASGAQYLARRTQLRESAARFTSVIERSLRLRFLLATPPDSVGGVASMHDEVSTYRDIVFLPINESRFNCALKPLLWYEHCARAFPTAQYYAIADDDTYLQLEHFVADIRTLRAAPDANVLWGLVMWYGAYDSATMVPHEAWGGWSYTDAGAVKLRRRIEKCRLAAQSPSDATNAVVAAAVPSAHRRHDPCSRISAANRATVARESLGEDAPWPVINGPLFAVSSHLARLLVSDPLPRAYLRELHATPRVRAALTRKGGPRKSNFGCWPVGDTIFGLWISRITTARNLSVQLVNSPFMVQHHPWPAAIHGAFSNSSIVLHGLKRERNQKKFRAIAEARGLGPHVPFRRKCASCAELGWSTWPGSSIGRWTCCGCDATQSKAECDWRMGQAPPPAAQSLQAGTDTEDRIKDAKPQRANRATRTKRAGMGRRGHSTI